MTRQVVISFLFNIGMAWYARCLILQGLQTLRPLPSLRQIRLQIRRQRYACLLPGRGGYLAPAQSLNC